MLLLPKFNPIILEQADETHAYLSNGDDGYALAFGSEGVMSLEI